MIRWNCFCVPVFEESNTDGGSNAAGETISKSSDGCASGTLQLTIGTPSRYELFSIQQ